MNKSKASTQVQAYLESESQNTYKKMTKITKMKKKTSSKTLKTSKTSKTSKMNSAWMISIELPNRWSWYEKKDVLPNMVDINVNQIFNSLKLQ